MPTAEKSTTPINLIKHTTAAATRKTKSTTTASSSSQHQYKATRDNQQDQDSSHTSSSTSGVDGKPKNKTRRSKTFLQSTKDIGRGDSSFTNDDEDDEIEI